MDDDLDDRLARIAGCTDAAECVSLGCDLADAGRQREAEACFRTAVDLGAEWVTFNLGNSLAAQGRYLEAVEVYVSAIAVDETDAYLNLGLALEELGDLAGAMRAYRGGADAGDSGAVLQLAFMLREQGEWEAAHREAQRAVEMGNQTAIGVVACWEWCTTLDPALEPKLRAGADFFPAARSDLAHLLIATARIEEARQVLERGAKLGEVESMLPLGNLYADLLGEGQAAEEAYRSAIAAGDNNSHHNLGLLLLDRGDVEGAREQLQLGADGGDALAAQALRDLEDEK